MKKKTLSFLKILLSSSAVALLLVCSSPRLPARDFYWQNPVKTTEVNSQFPKTASDGKSTYIFWQEVDTSSEKIWLSCQYLDGAGSWHTNTRFAGPFPYSGDIPDIYSAAVSSKGTVAAAVLSGINSLSVYVSSDGARTFTASVLPPQDKPLVAPRLYASKSGRFILFTTVGQNQSVVKRTASSDDGYRWSSFSDFQPAREMTNPFSPAVSSSAEGEAVVFQAQYISGNRISYQLYSSYSSDGGHFWSDPVLVSGADSLAPGDAHDFSSYHNQRPYLFTMGNDTYLGWERTYSSSENAHIWCAKITKAGIVPGSAEEISTSGNANRAVLFSYDNTLSIVWFDTRRGRETVHRAQKDGYIWNETSLSSGRQADMFAFPVITDSGKKLSFIWQENSAQKDNVSSICRLEPDMSVSRPSITALAFSEGKRSTAERVKMRVNLPSDSSGIAGFSWSWSQDPSQEPPESFMNLPAERSIETDADADGKWYFRTRAVDYAGNWSDYAELVYYRDLTPPLPPQISPPALDRYGFGASNTFRMTWAPDASDDDIAGYTWNLQYLSPVDRNMTETKRHPLAASDEEAASYVSSFTAEHSGDAFKADPPPHRLMGSSPSTSYSNSRNGLYVFSVAAVDTVGNIGRPSKMLLVLNKYVPSTYLLSVQKTSDVFGNVTLGIIGGGFTYDGTIRRIYIDKDGKAPYDLALDRGSGAFSVVSDSRIEKIKLGNVLKEGSYRIGLDHPDRGIYFSAAVLRIAENGTVKIEKQYSYVPSWIPVETKWQFHVQTGTILLWTVFILALAGTAAAMYGLIQTAKDSAAARMEVLALVTGEVMPMEKKKKTEVLKQKGISLRVKLMFFTSLLVIMIVFLVSIPLGINMTRTQERTLAQGLEQRISVLMESMTTGVKAYMPTQNVLELSYLPGQSSALGEAEYSTITGYPASGANTSLRCVWASNDKDTTAKISTKTLTYGTSELTDDTSVEIAKRCAELNDEAVKEAGEISSNISELNAEGASLALKTDSRSVARRDEIAQITTQLTAKFNTVMSNLSEKGSGSFPEFSSTQLDRTNTEYLFYRPVFYRQGSSQDYVRAIVLVKVSTTALVKSVDEARSTIIYTAAVIAIVAILIGAAGSFVVASIIVRPIKRLVAHVEIIGETRNKEKLANKDIKITSRDEIGQLGEAVNEMTHGLVKAAQEENLQMDGSAVQKAFLPLATSDKGTKETIARLNEDKMNCFGYYQGASGVSGDYFDYKKLDSRWYVLIKCDASGHGVPAALIMTVVATLFRKYFETWSYAKNGTNINILVTQINDFIESLGLKGKFATIIICLFDTQTGDVFMCNAGDNIVHIYYSGACQGKIRTIAEKPAAGPLPSMMVDMKGGFKVEKTTLRKGDVLFLYTDGIEEATRKFRDASFSVMKCAEPGMKKGDVHGNHKGGEESEQMEPERIQAIIEAVFAKTTFTLEKYHNPVPGEVLTFDFTTCSGSLEDVIIALASVEKVFRMYRDPAVTKDDTVRVDRKIDAFLKDHFSRYEYYCSSKTEPAEDSNYLEYHFLKEDNQLDDLTLIAMKRP